jgi:hypothetical protein
MQICVARTSTALFLPQLFHRPLFFSSIALKKSSKSTTKLDKNQTESEAKATKKSTKTNTNEKYAPKTQTNTQKRVQKNNIQLRDKTIQKPKTIEINNKPNNKAKKLAGHDIKINTEEIPEKHDTEKITNDRATNIRKERETETNTKIKGKKMETNNKINKKEIETHKSKDKEMETNIKRKEKEKEMEANNQTKEEMEANNQTKEEMEPINKIKKLMEVAAKHLRISEEELHNYMNNQLKSIGYLYFLSSLLFFPLSALCFSLPFSLSFSSSFLFWFFSTPTETK